MKNSKRIIPTVLSIVLLIYTLQIPAIATSISIRSEDASQDSSTIVRATRTGSISLSLGRIRATLVADITSCTNKGTAQTIHSTSFRDWNITGTNPYNGVRLPIVTGWTNAVGKTTFSISVEAFITKTGKWEARTGSTVVALPHFPGATPMMVGLAGNE